MKLLFKIHQLKDFLDTGIWRIRSKHLPRSKSFLINPLRILILSVREFNDNKCQLYASALTFYTLLSIVPVVAVAFGVAKGFGFEKILEDQLFLKFPGQEQTIGKIIHFANNLLANTKGGLVAGAGVIVLFYTAIRVLNSIEESFNHIWGIKKGRSLSRKISDYLSMLLICPFIIIVSSGLTVFISTQLHSMLEKMAFMDVFGPLVIFLLFLLPYVMIWSLFAYIYIFIPNTHIKISSGIIGGIIAGTLYQVLQIIYINFQIGIGNYNAIYGSFAALPLFLIWLQISWLIVLFGTEITFAYQNVKTYEFEKDCLNISPYCKRIVLLHILTIFVKRFAKSEPPLNSEEVSSQTDIPIRLVEDILYQLSQADLLSEVSKKHDKQIHYQPSRDINLITIQYVFDTLDKKGTEEIPIIKTAELVEISECLHKFEEQIKTSPANKLLKEI